MDKNMIKTIIASVIITTVVLVEAYFVYFVVNMNMQVKKNTQAVEQIVTFLNSQIKKTEPTQ